MDWFLIRAVFEEKDKKRIRHIIWASFWGFWLGGANYMTALLMAICSFLVIVLIIMKKTGVMSLEGAGDKQVKSFCLLLIPTLSCKNTASTLLYYPHICPLCNEMLKRAYSQALQLLWLKSCQISIHDKLPENSPATVLEVFQALHL